MTRNVELGESSYAFASNYGKDRFQKVSVKREMSDAPRRECASALLPGTVRHQPSKDVERINLKSKSQPKSSGRKNQPNFNQMAEEVRAPTCHNRSSSSVTRRDTQENRDSILFIKQEENPTANAAEREAHHRANVNSRDRRSDRHDAVSPSQQEKENMLQPEQTEDFRRSFDQKSPSELKTTNGSNLRSLAFPGKKGDSPLRGMVLAAMNNSVSQTNQGSRDNLRSPIMDKRLNVSATPMLPPNDSFSRDDPNITMSKSRSKNRHVRMPTERERSAGSRVEMSPEFRDGHSYTITQAQSATLGPKTNVSDYRSRRSAISSLSNVGKPTVHRVDLRSEDNRSLQRQIEDKLSKIQKIFEGQ